MAITVSMLHQCRGAMHTQVRFFFPDLGLGGAGRALNSSVGTYVPSHLPTYLPTYLHTYIQYVDILMMYACGVMTCISGTICTPQLNQWQVSPGTMTRRQVSGYNLCLQENYRFFWRADHFGHTSFLKCQATAGLFAGS